MRIGSLFSGYGGADLAVQSVFPDATPAWFVEYDKHPSTVLAKHWPTVPNYGDVTTVDWSAVEPVDILTGGYPCQPFSHAGKRKGTNDDRHLFPYVAAAVGVLRPRFVFLENVYGHLTLGGTDVIGTLTGLGYDARWGVVRASDAGAPHRRARLFIVATADAGSVGLHGWPGVGGTGRDKAIGEQAGDHPVNRDQARPTADTESIGSAPATQNPPRRREGELENGRHRQRRLPHPVTDFGTYTPAVRRWEHTTGRPAPAPTEPGRNGPRLSAAFVEWLMGLPHGWVTGSGIPRSAQLKALGNGIVPQQMALALRLLLDEAVVA